MELLKINQRDENWIVWRSLTGASHQRHSRKDGLCTYIPHGLRHNTCHHSWQSMCSWPQVLRAPRWQAFEWSRHPLQRPRTLMSSQIYYRPGTISRRNKIIPPQVSCSLARNPRQERRIDADLVRQWADDVIYVCDR